MNTYLSSRLLQAVGAYISGSMDVTLPDGKTMTLANGTPGPRSEVVIHDGSLFDDLRRGGWHTMGDGYLEGKWSTSDLQAFLDHVHTMDNGLYDALSAGWLPRMIEKFRFWRQRNTKAQAKKNIEYHYDLGNDFYGLWLDDTMTYSSAIFTDGQESLEAAQTAKYKSMVDQMGVRPGDHILEIGCGWGGFAEYAAKERGLHVTGLTISKEQLAFAQTRIKKAGLEGQVTLKLQDYRDERGRYDGIASIEMFEAVGEQYWPAYFETVRNCLHPGRQATLQIITVAHNRWQQYRSRVDFIQKHIFPGGMLPSPALLREQVEKAGLLFQTSVEFGESYSLTLRRWHETFNDRWAEVAKLGFDDRFYRMWVFYLTSCAALFRYGGCDVTQVTIQRPA